MPPGGIPPGGGPPGGPFGRSPAGGSGISDGSWAPCCSRHSRNSVGEPSGAAAVLSVDVATVVVGVVDSVVSLPHAVASSAKPIVTHPAITRPAPALLGTMSSILSSTGHRPGARVERNANRPHHLATDESSYLPAYSKQPARFGTDPPRSPGRGYRQWQVFGASRSCARRSHWCPEKVRQRTKPDTRPTRTSSRCRSRRRGHPATADDEYTRGSLL